jgi:predicted nicotinamide N-methyase
MSSALLNAKLVISTDLEDILNSNTKINYLNNNKNLNLKNLKFETLEWDNMNNINNIFNKYKQIDYIFICECLYIEAPFNKLLKTMIKFCKNYKNIKILFAYKKRYKFQDECMENIKKYFEIKEVNRNELHKDFINNLNYVFLYINLK